MHPLLAPELANFYYIGGSGLGLLLLIVIVVLLLR
jgi:cellobiose-specific phosphotransferase system component IIC